MLAIQSGKCPLGQFSRTETAGQMAQNGAMSPERVRQKRRENQEGDLEPNLGAYKWQPAKGNPLSGMPISQSQPSFGDGPDATLSMDDRGLLLPKRVAAGLITAMVNHEGYLGGMWVFSKRGTLLAFWKT